MYIWTVPEFIILASLPSQVSNIILLHNSSSNMSLSNNNAGSSNQENSAGGSFTGTVIDHDGQEVCPYPCIPLITHNELTIQYSYYQPQQELTNSSDLAGPSQGMPVIPPASVASVATQATASVASVATQANPPFPTRAQMIAMFRELPDAEVVDLRHFLLVANLSNGNDEGEPEWV